MSERVKCLQLTGRSCGNSKKERKDGKQEGAEGWKAERFEQLTPRLEMAVQERDQYPFAL